MEGFWAEWGLIRGSAVMVKPSSPETRVHPAYIPLLVASLIPLESSVHILSPSTPMLPDSFLNLWHLWKIE
ncbi:hypothetical protein CK203_079343 [Vitis vinifera]|uniref:Uncharacterized protein n=1 Tax=Vitis vinifera TaxID=29760 RepID=A0A438DGH7_VITVI|nr:hypothetical protein CK203_079343 [Vitis vinifera]